MPSNNSVRKEENVPLLEDSPPTIRLKEEGDHDDEQDLSRRVWIESKKLWQVTGPAVFSRLSSCSMIVITQGFAGHLGDLELAAISIACNVIIGFDLGFLPTDIAELSGKVALCLLPLHFAFAFQCPLQRFLQSQRKNSVIAWSTFAALVVHVVVNWLFVYRLQLGLVATVITLGFSWWVMVLLQLLYTVFGGCPLTWDGFSIAAFSDLWEFVKLSAASGVMLCLEYWYYKILVLMTGNLENSEIVVDALSIWNRWKSNDRVRVANELGAGHGKGAKFAATVSVVTSIAIGLFFWLLVMLFHNELALIFSSSKPVLQEVNKLSVLLAFTILLNSVQPILSGVAVGSGWQSYVAYINLGCYYLVGLPLGYFMEYVFHQGVMGIWAGMIFGGTALQTLILAIITIRCDWEKEAQRASMHLLKWSSTLEEH
ncbi:hypothetical protein FEM48_Zijuj08G0148500 [Ziziphus jujuba var. spinosa]|uniref:Protein DETOXIFICATION 27-like n=1 Tax=Ziziphus jujuba var. spinosa TaxID=714518 RepID=A0A978UZR6_ZIZJJ|nr:hypothetical protein FEM48_Zijuj08G0148500 [Ziziphus jujuba var. spinosa]